MAKGLGKGFQALFPTEEQENEKVQEIKLSECRPNPYQPRKTFKEESLEELTESVKQHGILQPIVVRKSIKGYEIVVGERRYRAAKSANLEVIPAIVRELTEDEMMEIALVENLQREDLSPIEEGTAYQMLMEQLGLTQEQLAQRLGKSRPHIANYIRVLSLPAPVKQLIENGEITMGHGRALLGLKQKNKILPLVEKVRKEQLNVRKLEELVQRLNQNVSRETSKKEQKTDYFIKERETNLRERFGTSVKIKENKNKGKIEIQFFSRDDLERILSILHSEG
ncbi:ParB/RepB/Spo0J family partition protein [Bacillus tianshenii]|nr:ParB/RepB/Spo0J family partition protein [Bacillus tianshenii]